MDTNAKEFVTSIVGNKTGEEFKGKFVAKLALSHREQLTRDKVRRELLGPDALNASARAQNQAEIFAELAVRLTNAPSWWKDAQGGLDLIDDNVVAEIYKLAMEIETEHLKGLREAAAKAKAELE